MAAKTKKTDLKEDAFDKAILAWFSPDIIRYHKGPIWYAFAILINTSLIAYSIFTHSFTMTLLFLVLPIVYYLEQRRKPKLELFVLSAYGIKFGDIKIPYSNIKKFWIIHEAPFIDELHFLTENKIHPELTIQLMGMDPVLLRNFLVSQIHEWEGKKQSLLEMIIKILRLA